jgi:hypothetical protein
MDRRERKRDEEQNTKTNSIERDGSEKEGETMI